jgi:hypothetical protein
MRTSPSIVPGDDDQDIYLVMDDFGGRLGLAWRETDPDSTTLRSSSAIYLMDNIPTRSVWLDSILRKAGRGTFPKTSPMNSADSRPNRCGLLNRVPHNEDGNEEN